MSFKLKNKNELLVSTDRKNEDFDVPDLIENIGETTLEFGKMNLKEWIFNGIVVRESMIKFNETMQMDWEGDFEMVTMHFNLKGSLELNTKSGDETSFSFKNNQHNLMYGSEAGGDIKVKELIQHIFMIQINREAFFKITENGNEVLKRFADQVSKGKTVALSQQNLSIDLNMQNCINDILKCSRFGALKKMYLLSKTIELMVLQAEAYNNTLNISPKFARSDYDTERIIYAKEYLLQHIELPPTLTELSRIASINEFKLKKGFKEIYGTTVFGYLAETRLELAKNDLFDRVKPVSQIAFELGYSSVQHFSAAFKKKFGIPPSKISGKDF